MTYKLSRNEFRDDGIFSTLICGDKTYCTLEHAYDSGNGDGSYAPKLPHGTYTCTRYFSPKHKYYVFVVNGVPGHSFIEFHIGNYNKDSDGCILVGSGTHPSAEGMMVTNSTASFHEFMNDLEGIDEFSLEVS